MTSEMLLTVPASWITISNGKLVGVKAEADGTKTWDWKQSEPLSSYLISAIAGDFVEKDDSWRGMPLRYVVPRGQEYKIDDSFSHTKADARPFLREAGRALSLGAIRADVRRRLRRRRNGEHQRDHAHRARTGESRRSPPRIAPAPISSNRTNSRTSGSAISSPARTGRTSG